MSGKNWFIYLCSFSAFGLSAQPQKLGIQKITVFENNLCYIVKEGPIRFLDRNATLDGTPDALGGTYWLGTNDDFSISSVSFAQDTVYRQQDCKDFFDLLRANVGLKAEVTYQIGNEVETVSGEILPYSLNSDIISLKKQTGSTVFVKKNQIQQVAIIGDAQTRFNEKIIGETTRVKVSKDVVFGNLQLMYYQKGVEWKPGYLLKILNDNECQFTMRANIVNHLEDLTNTKVKLVLGKPVLQIGDKPFDAKPNSEFTAVSGNKSLKIKADEETKPELFYFDAGTLSIPKETETQVSLNTSKQSYQFLYECVLPNFAENASANFVFPQTEFPVYQSIKIENASDIPFAPGLVSILDKNERAVAQDYMAYVAPHEQFKIHINKEQGLQLLASEELFNREDKHKKTSNGSFDLIRVKGSLALKNLKDEKVYVEISKPFFGRMTKTSFAEVIKTNKMVGENQVMMVQWKYEIMPKSTQVISYEYEFLNPSK